MGFPKRYEFRPEQDELMRQRYDPSDSESITQLSELLGFPRYTVTHRACVLGLSKKRKAWNEADEEFLMDNWGKMSDAAICRKMGRTYHSVVLKAKQLGISRRMAVLSLRDLEKLFGVDVHLVRRWVQDGHIKATQTAIGCGGGKRRVWSVDEDSLERFITDKPWMYDWRRMAPCEYWTNLAEQVQRAEQWLSAPEADRFLGVKPHTVCKYLSRGWLAGGQRCYGEGGHLVWKIRKSDLSKFQWRRPELVGHPGRSYAL